MKKELLFSWIKFVKDVAISVVNAFKIDKKSVTVKVVRRKICSQFYSVKGVDEKIIPSPVEKSYRFERFFLVVDVDGEIMDLKVSRDIYEVKIAGTEIKIKIILFLGEKYISL